MTLRLFVLAFAATTAASGMELSTGGPYGRLARPTVMSVAVAPSAPSVVYALTESIGGQLNRSLDGGQSWQALTFLTDRYIERLAVDPSNPFTIYVISERSPYRSDDGGRSWKRLASDLAGGYGFIVTALLVDPQDPSTVYFASACFQRPDYHEAGVYKSTDRGETWTQLSSLGRNTDCVYELALDPAAPGHLYALSQGSAFRSDDAGMTWTRSANPLPTKAVVADPNNPMLRYGITEFGTSGLLVSSDAGRTWLSAAQTGPPYAVGLALDPATQRLFLAGATDGLFRSDDRGGHWTRVRALPPDAVAVVSSGNALFVATAFGLYHAFLADPEVWEVAPIGQQRLAGVAIYSYALDPTDASTLFAGGLEGPSSYQIPRVYRSIDGGAHWQAITTDDDRILRQTITVDAAGDLYAASGGMMWSFAKATQTWQSWTSPDLPSQVGWHLLANPRRRGVLYTIGPYQPALYSVDGGRNWSAMNGVSGLRTVSVAPNGFDLFGGGISGVFESHDGGATWLPNGGAENSSATDTWSIAIAPSRPQMLYRLSAIPGTLAALFRSNDAGTTWMRLVWPGEHGPLDTIAVDPLDYLSLWIGPLHSSDGGETWTWALPAGVSSAKIDRDGKRLFVVGQYNVQIFWTKLRNGHPRAVR